MSLTDFKITNSSPEFEELFVQAQQEILTHLEMHPHCPDPANCWMDNDLAQLPPEVLKFCFKLIGAVLSNENVETASFVMATHLIKHYTDKINDDAILNATEISDACN